MDASQYKRRWSLFSLILKKKKDNSLFSVSSTLRYLVPSTSRMVTFKIIQTQNANTEKMYFNNILVKYVINIRVCQNTYYTNIYNYSKKKCLLSDPLLYSLFEYCFLQTHSLASIVISSPRNHKAIFRIVK